MAGGADREGAPRQSERKEGAAGEPKKG